MRIMRLGRDYEIRRDNDDPLNRRAWIIFIRGHGYDKLCGRYRDVLKVGQNISFAFEPTFIPSHLKDPGIPTSEQDLSGDKKLQSILSGILYDILDRGRIEESLIFTDVNTGQNLNKATK